LGVTIFLTTQYLEEADRLCDRVGIINGGRLAAEGTPEELKRSVGQDLVVVSTHGELDGVVEKLRTLPAVERVEARGEEITIATPDGPRVVGRVAVTLEESGVTAERLTLRTPTLDDVFLEVTGNRMALGDESEETR
jgi:ABC-2 type transport system ATP-binding protein